VAGHRQRLAALVFTGVAGLAVTVTFAVLSAPDLALTQLLVEVVSIVLLLLALNFLPATVPPEPPGPARARDAVLAGLAGLGIAAVTLAALTQPSASIAGYYLANAIPGAAGANAVNVIIVDFRGFDTLGEITVLGLAGLLVAALLRDLPGPAGAPPPRSFLLDPGATALLPLAVTVAVFLFLRGHNAPGGGFIAGLLLAAGLLLPYLARGHRAVDPLLPAGWQGLVAAGLATALATGLGSLALGFPFLTSAYLAPTVPVLGKLSLPSAALFDLGVLLVVVGATLAAVLALGRPATPAAVPEAR
jgi:multicomponent K+:H+ antiporter subunit A